MDKDFSKYRLVEVNNTYKPRRCNKSELILLCLASEAELPLVCMLDGLKVMAHIDHDGSFTRLYDPFDFIYGFLSQFIVSRNEYWYKNLSQGVTDV